MNDETPIGQQRRLIRRLVRDMLASGRAAEDVCRDHPDLIAAVRRQRERVGAVEDQLDAIFPIGTGDDGAPPADDKIPQIPGYVMEHVLGRGGMGVVYKARHVSLNRIVAIKVPLAGALATATERERHAREARAVAALAHPNIITVYDVGEFAGRPYFTMEFIDGQNLGARLSNTPQPARDAATMLATLADAVHCAHQAGIIHRDLKPANVLLAPGGTPKITDFGLARSTGGDASVTVTGAQLGTPSYMAPEQARGGPDAQGATVDIYALGSILYETMTGRPPFHGESVVETVRQVLEEEPAPPSRLNPRAPRDLETICLTCLRKEPHRRYPTAAAFAQDLRRFLGGLPIKARPVTAAERLYRWGRRHPARAALLATAIGVLLASVGVGFWLQHLENVRVAETATREGRARQEIETSVSLAQDLRTNERWVEAGHLLDEAKRRLPEANSADLARVLDDAHQHLAAAWELHEIRRRYPESNDRAFDYRPAAEAYQRVFTRLGFGDEVPLEAAAHAVARSPIRAQILIALDNAALVSRIRGVKGGLDRPLAVARVADPDPWRDRFRQPAVWTDPEALLALHRATGATTDSSQPHQVVIVGVLLGRLGANDKAITILRDAQRRNPVDFWVNLELGNALARAGRSWDAAQYFRAAVTIQPKNPGPWVTLGVHLNVMGRREEAMLAVRTAIDLNPRVRLAWRNYISFLRGAGRIAEAEAALTKAIEHNPDQREAFDGLRNGLAAWAAARELASRGEWQRAWSAYEAMLPDGLGDAEFWFEAAALSLIVGRHDAFLQTREAVLTPGRPAPLRAFLVARAVTLIPAPVEQLAAATALSEADLAGNGPQFWALRQRGALLSRAGNHHDAIPLFEQSIAAQPSPGRAVLGWLWLAITCHRAGMPAEAARWHAMATAWLNARPDGMPEDAEAAGLHLHDWLEARVLRREADTLITGNGVGPGRESR
jgi:eukaryotic-like serine/threonine-protein kinase